MAGSRGGRRAAQPVAGWKAPERLLEGGLAVRFIAEKNGQEKIFDFAALPVEPQVGRWLARAFARRTGPRHAMKHTVSAEQMFGTVKAFAEVLSRQWPAVTDVTGVTTVGLQAFREGDDGKGRSEASVELLRSLLRDDPELSPQVRTALVLGWARPKRSEPETPKEQEYTDTQWQQITTVLRRDVRIARDRIRAGRDLLARYRAGEIPAGSVEETEGRLLDVFDRTGDFPRYAAKTRCHVNDVHALGGSAALASRLCLTLHEMTAFALLLTALTGENFGTIAAWPAAHYRPDGGRDDGPRVVLVEETKARRGPEREHMVVALEDLPSGLAEVLSASAEEDRLLRSPLRVYQLLLELTELSRSHGGHTGAFTARSAGTGRFGGSGWVSGVGSHHVKRWAHDRGFANAQEAELAGRPPINVRRIRQTVIERRRRPVAHNRSTMNDQYLMPSQRVQRESRSVVAAAMHEEVGKARARQGVPVFTAAFVARFQHDPDSAAAEAGLEVPVVKRLLEGEQDTVLASCTDHLAGPHTDPGQPCPASFLSCLDCRNSRALPHQLPVQLAAAQRIAALRPNLDPAVWNVRWQPRLDQLEEIVNSYTHAEREQARRDITDRQRRLVEEFLDGRWDLR